MKGDRFTYRSRHNIDVTDPYIAEEIANDIETAHPQKKAGMRMRFNRKEEPIIEWYSDLGHGRDDREIAYKKIKGFISKRIGQQYYYIYSEFLGSELNDGKQRMYCSPTDIFRQAMLAFDVVDGIVVGKHKVPIRRGLVVRRESVQVTYKLNERAWNAAQHILRPLMGTVQFFDVKYKEYVTKEYIDKLWNYLLVQDPEINIKLCNIRYFQEFKGPYLLWDDWPRALRVIFREERSVYDVIPYGTKEYWELKKRLKREKRKKPEINEKSLYKLQHHYGESNRKKKRNETRRNKSRDFKAGY